MTKEIKICELLFDILDLVKFELKFYKQKESPLFERIVKTRYFQQKLQKLKDFILKYFDIMYEDESSPLNQAALHSQLDNIAKITNYYNDLSVFYEDQMKQLIPRNKLLSIIEYSHIEILFLIFTNILDWEHYKSSLLFPNDKEKEKMLKKFLEELSKSKIKDTEDLIYLEQYINNFVETIEIL